MIFIPVSCNVMEPVTLRNHRTARYPMIPVKIPSPVQFMRLQVTVTVDPDGPDDIPETESKQAQRPDQAVLHPLLKEPVVGFYGKDIPKVVIYLVKVT